MKLRSLLGLVVSACCVASVASCGGTDESHKIGVMVQSTTSEEYSLQKDYLENYIAPKFNCEFVFSETCNDASAAQAFVEQASAAGCDGIISYYTNFQAPITNTAKKLGLKVITNGNNFAEGCETNEATVGMVSTPVSNTVENYTKVINDVILNDGKVHNFIICSAGAANKMSEQHYLTTKAIFESLQTRFGVTYKDVADLADLAKSNTQKEIEAVKDGETLFKITLYPGFPQGASYGSTFGDILTNSNGLYDSVLSVGTAYSPLLNPIKQYEQATNKDVKLITLAPISQAAVNAFNNGQIDGAIINPNTPLLGTLFGLLKNALDGYQDTLWKDGKARIYPTYKWAVSNVKDAAKLCSIDNSFETWAFTEEVIKGMLISENKSLTSDAIYKYLEDQTADAVIARLTK